MKKEEISELLDDIVYWWIDTEYSANVTGLILVGHLVTKYQLASSKKGQERFRRMQKEFQEQKEK